MENLPSPCLRDAGPGGRSIGADGTRGDSPSCERAQKNLQAALANVCEHRPIFGQRALDRQGHIGFCTGHPGLSPMAEHPPAPESDSLIGEKVTDFKCKNLCGHGGPQEITSPVRGLPLQARETPTELSTSCGAILGAGWHPTCAWGKAGYNPAQPARWAPPLPGDQRRAGGPGP